MSNEPNMTAASDPAAATANDSAPAPDPAVPSPSTAHLPASSSQHNPTDAPILASVLPPDDAEFALRESHWDAASAASTSVASSVYKHTYENGRRFHSYKYGRYPLPNDEAEQNREDVKHAMMLELTDGRLFYSPLGRNPQKILDVGTGTGIWAIDMADQFPSAEVLGIDLSPIQPTWVPPNCKFLVDDAEDEWLNGEDWDMVHFRTMVSVLKDVPRALRSTYSCLKPGGWLEMQELEAMAYCDDETMPPDDPLITFYKTMHEALGRFGMDLTMPRNMRPLLEDAGFVNIRCVVKKVPAGPWAADRTLRVVGMYLHEAILEVVPAMTSKPFLTLMSKLEAELLGAAVRKTLKDGSRHRYLQFHFWTAQRPE